MDEKGLVGLLITNILKYANNWRVLRGDIINADAVVSQEMQELLVITMTMFSDVRKLCSIQRCHERRVISRDQVMSREDRRSDSSKQVIKNMSTM